MVSAIPLLDAVANSPAAYDADSPAERQVRLANELVAASLDDFRHLQTLDECGPQKKWRRLYVRETEAEMRRMYEAWSGPSSELLARAREMSGAGQRVERVAELLEAVRLARGLMATTVGDIERGREQIRRGEFVTLEEARRELRAAAGR
jgi:hypothetical protein